MEEYVVQNIFHGGREERIQAATELAKLSSKQRRKVAEMGVITPLISMTQSQDFEAIEAAIFALLSLAFGSERNKIQIVKAGIVPVLLELLHCQIESLLELTVATFLTISSCGPNKLTIMSSGVIPVLLEILSDNYPDMNNRSSTSLQAKLDTLATLHNLATCHQIVPCLVSSGMVYKLFQLIQRYEKSSELVEKATSLLENITYMSKNALLQAVGTGDTIRILVEMIEDGSPQGKEHALGILLQTCQTCRDKYRELILREGVMPGLLQLSVDGTRRAKDMAQELLLLLRDCSGCSMSAKKSKHDLFQQIMQEIDAEGEKALDATTPTLLEDFMAKLRT
ncbi:hypothetical protein K2173_019990 [Erythroxylum novogranatense]|uniref:U-box domain-containing protein n=1 Tax=Erythroxylum novogranatense TaxID=1862640 RepID=A0AAV8U6P9_9ROSI|nr:hypothetical protein K2173_019990 [Erythroxylum novogranatense]